MPPEIDEAPENQDQPTTQEAPETPDQPTSEESFTDFDPSTIPEDADREWLAKRYGELQSGWTQKTQGLAQERQEAQELRQFVEAMQDPATRDAILEREFGYEFEDEEPNEEYLDPTDELRAEIEALKGNLTQQQESQLLAEQEAEMTDALAEEIEGLEKSKGNDFEFSGEELAFLTSYANNHPMPNGAPDVKGADDALNKILDQRKQAWVESKKSPRRISQGKPGSEAKIPKDRDERLAMAVEAMEDASS